MKEFKEKLGVPGSCWVVKDGRGLVLRVLPNFEACGNWIRKHFPGEKKKEVSAKRLGSKKEIGNEFARQMKLGLGSLREIDHLIWYGGVSTGTVFGRVPSRPKRNRRRNRS